MDSEHQLPRTEIRGVKILPAKAEDCEELGPELRQADRQELYAASGKDAVAGLRASFEVTQDCFTAWRGGSPIAMFGCTPGPTDFGVVWLLGSDRLFNIPVTLHRVSEEWLPLISRDYSTIGNFVDERNIVHRRWLERLGFTDHGIDREYGFLRLPFHLYIKSV